MLSYIPARTHRHSSFELFHYGVLRLRRTQLCSKVSEKVLSYSADGVQVIPRWWHCLGGRGESTFFLFHFNILLNVSEKAASGIGKETAFSFAEAGVQAVVCADLNEEGAKQVVEESKTYAKHAGYRAIAVKLDIADEQSVKSLIATTVKEFGRIDYAVNSAGVGTISKPMSRSQVNQSVQRLMAIIPCRST